MKSTLRKMGVLLIAGVMLFIMSMPAYASVTEVQIDKIYTTDTNLSSPAETFTFEFTAGPAASITESDGTTVAYTTKPGVLTALGNTAPTAAYAAGVYNATTGKKEIKVSVDPTKFTEPGFYRYLLKETKGSTAGVTYDSTVYTVDLFIVNDGNNGFECASVIVKKTTDNGATGYSMGENGLVSGKAGGSSGEGGGVPFNNMYKNDTGEDATKLHDVKVTKLLTGNQAVDTDKFPFEVSLDASTVTKARDITVVYKETTEGTEQTAVLNAANSYKVSNLNIGKGGTVTIKGLAATEKYTVKETDAKGYTVSDDDADSAAGTVDGVVATSDGATIANEIENSKGGTVPTGLFLNYKPFWIMGAVAIALIALFLGRRKNRRSDVI